VSETFANQPLAVGLVGAGPWAKMVHAPVLAAGPETRLAGVWARRADAAARLAGRHGAPAFSTFDELLDNCEAVAFAIAPSAQPDLAITAARAGKALLLEKPLADNFDDAQRLADAVGEAGVGSMVVLSYRYAEAVRAFLREAEGFAATGGRGCFISGGFLGGPFSESPWRQEQGALLDVGPHAIDLLDAALGSVVQVDARRSSGDWVALLLEHEGGAVSEVALSGRTGIERSRVNVELYGPSGVLEIDAVAAVGPEVFATLRSEFADVARTRRGHECDVQRGLHLQRLIGQAEGQLRAHST
jgi:predicted dehydrogenase